MKAIAAIVVTAVSAFAAPAHAQLLEADLSTRQIAITSSYVGEDLVLFGTRDGEGDIIVVVRGPDTANIVRRKERIAGLWLNRAAVEFRGVPGLYALAASTALESAATEAFLAANEIGVGHLRFEAVAGGDVESAAFAAALVRDRQRVGLFAEEVAPVHFVGERLFRAEFYLPAAAPVGTYTATIYLLRGGEVAATNTAVLNVTKAGLGRAVYDYSYQQPALYGVLAVVLALIAGWFAATVFTRW